MNHALIHQEPRRPLPIVLAYPNVYQRLLTSTRKDDFQTVLGKCGELATNRPIAQNRHGGFFGMGGVGDGKQLALFTVWSNDEKPDIFIMAGYGDGFGPGHTCPSKEELRKGIYGDLILVSFL